MIKSIQSSALAGIHRAQSGMRSAAADIARAPTEEGQGNITRSLVELHQHKQAAKANIQTLRTADDTLGILIDELA